jgi:glucokinase
VSGFLAAQQQPKVEAVCFGVAGAVIDGRCHTTNLPWVLEESSLSTLLGGVRVKLLNDVEATAYGMLHLPPDDLAPLHPPEVKARRGNIAVVAVGTGLGEGVLYWDGGAYHPLPSEGGHSDFAPRTDAEIELLRYLTRQLGGHVSYERVVSGPGFSNLYAFLRDTGFAPESPALRTELERGDRNAVIARLGLAGSDPLCSEAVRLFCAILGAEAGNLALKCFALGGVYIAGGIPPKVLPALRRGDFWEAFVGKGRFEELMSRLPVWVNMNEGAALLGAAHYAALMARR